MSLTGCREETLSKNEWMFQPVIELASPESSEIEVHEYDVEETLWESDLLDLRVELEKFLVHSEESPKGSQAR